MSVPPGQSGQSPIQPVPSGQPEPIAAPYPGAGGVPPGYAYPQGGQFPPGGQYPGVPPQVPAPTPKGKNTLGLIAFIVGIVGFVFACIPGALIVGWVLLPIAFVLAIVSFFRPGKKTLGVWALILSIVGTIVGVVVFLAVVAGAVDEALEETTSSSVTTPSSDAAETEAPAESEEAAETEAPAESEAPVGDVGTRENPAPLGSVLAGDEWEVVVNAIDLNATDAVIAANMFNEPPAEGNTYALVNVTVTYRGAESSFDTMVGLAWVTADGRVIESFDSMAIAPDPTLGLNELYTDASFTGNEVLEIPADGLGLLRVTPGIFADELFVTAN